MVSLSPLFANIGALLDGLITGMYIGVFPSLAQARLSAQLEKDESDPTRQAMISRLGGVPKEYKILIASKYVVVKKSIFASEILHLIAVST